MKVATPKNIAVSVYTQTHTGIKLNSISGGLNYASYVVLLRFLDLLDLPEYN